MHELSVCQSLIHQVTTIAHEHRAQSVSRIKLMIGPLSGVEPQLLAQAFPIARAGTVADEADLVIESLAITVRCRDCGAETEAEPNRLICDHCGNWHTDVISGDELLLASVELKTEEEHAHV